MCAEFTKFKENIDNLEKDFSLSKIKDSLALLREIVPHVMKLRCHCKKCACIGDLYDLKNEKCKKDTTGE